MQAVPIPGLELGTLLAVSPYGRTHRAFYKHQPVAVKVHLSLPHLSLQSLARRLQGYPGSVGCCVDACPAL